MGGKNQSVTHFLTMITWMDLLLVHWTCFVRGGCQWLGVFGGFFLKLIGRSGRNVHRWFWRMQQAMKVRPSPLGALFHAAAFGISTGPQGLSTWRIARWHSHTSLKHAAAPASLSLSDTHCLSPPRYPRLSLFISVQLNLFRSFPQISSTSLTENVCFGPRELETPVGGWMSKVRKQGTRQFMSLDLEQGSRVTLARPLIHRFCQL